MRGRIRLPERCPTLGEEIANSVSHGVGLLAAAIVVPALIVAAVRQGDGGFIVGASIFAGSILLMYLSSTLYHALPDGRAKRVFRVLDHGAIYLLIAGTYSPFTLGLMKGPWGWTLFGLVWAMAVTGIVLKALGRAWHPILSTGLYLAMGWLGIVALKPLWTYIPLDALGWLAVGGLAYTAGTGFYAMRRTRYAHFVWHLFVVAGTACHVVAVLACAS
ncbi:MAG TPA: hemolysin III family protein [Candidatus Polarisedimenticolaceae bacterium]|nr:hemolysin III family protein [Candidatus Polarisedimenticolaceae bacterium]